MKNQRRVLLFLKGCRTAETLRTDQEKPQEEALGWEEIPAASEAGRIIKTGYLAKKKYFFRRKINTD